MSKALAILSGGQDSTACLAYAAARYDEVHAVTFEYGQKHSVELESARRVGELLGVASHEFVRLGPILKGSSPLISDTPLGKYGSPDDLPGGVEPTFVPGRNLLFLTLAANRAAILGISDLFAGLCQEDFGGYPDCRKVFVDAMAMAVGEGIHGDPNGFRIHTPLMFLSKKESVFFALDLLGDRFDEVFEATHTCYDGVRGGCGKCHACHLRDRGFRESGVADPIWKFRGSAVA